MKALVGVANKISLLARKKVDEIRPHFEAELRQDGIFDWLDELDALLFDSLDEDELKHLINHHLNQTNEFNKKQFHKVLKSAYGVNIFVSEPWLNDPLVLAELDNIDLIKNISRDLHDRLRGRFVRAVRNGERWESVKADLEKLFNLPKKRATLIARDQIGKLNGQLTRLRQENIGVKSYIWRGMLDERERERHVEREGKQFHWDEAPEDGHPGQPILCRCYAEAVLPDFDELQGVIYADKPLTFRTNHSRSSLKTAEAKQMRTKWDDNFPDTIIDRKLADATSHPLYQAAKQGDIGAAYQLAQSLVSDEAVAKLKTIIGNKSAVLVPVHAEEAVGRNMIPIATATVLSKRLNIPVELSIVQATKVSRTGGDGWHRLINSPAFDGVVPRENAIILDDTQTQGGTLASLKGYIESHNGKVIASYALTGKQYSVQLRLSKSTLNELRSKYGELEGWWEKEFGYDFSKLTEWEARFIINSRKTPDEVRNTIIARKQA